MKANSAIAPHHPSLLLAIYLELIKFRLLILVLVSVCMGFYISFNEQASYLTLLWALIGIFFVGGGANTLNQWLELDADTLMLRTQMRPLPCKRITPNHALVFGLFISVLGFIILAALVNPLTLYLSFISWSSYLFIYTPLKKRSPVNTWVGAVPGAIPVVLGSTAASGSLSLPAVIFFLILFIWQMPHFFAISWIYRKDYLSGGFKMLSWDDDSGVKTSQQVLYNAVLILPACACLYFYGHAGLIYFLITLFASLYFIYLSVLFYLRPEIKQAKRVFRYSIIYLPVVFFAIIIDRLLFF